MDPDQARDFVRLSLPEAMEPLVEYFRGLAGEHSDWDDYRESMRREKRVLVRIGPLHAGPDRQGRPSASGRRPARHQAVGDGSTRSVSGWKVTHANQKVSGRCKVASCSPSAVPRRLGRAGYTGCRSPRPRTLRAARGSAASAHPPGGLRGLRVPRRAGGPSAQRYLPWVTVVVGILLLVAGLWLLAGGALPCPKPRLDGTAPITGAVGSVFGFGVSDAAATLTCTTAPFLAVVVSACRTP